MRTLEHQLELDLIEKLRDLKYIHREDIRDRASLENNFRKKFQALNKVELSDKEFTRLLDQIITPDVFEAAQRLRSMNSFERDDGTQLNYTLVNIKDWCKNDFEVVNQLRMNTRDSTHRYDVILLINGLPVVQIELKKMDIEKRRAMEQIVNYKNDPGNGYANSLMCFMQMFIASNWTTTRYFANNNNQHFNFNADERFLPVYTFASEDNRKINSLDQFADKFLPKCTLGEMVSRYMVLVASEKKLLMMRPYQIYAVKAIVESIKNQSGNGFIWHTTGSGKTLTSFKASTLLKDDPNIDKCLFVVDRKDLDRQTREEFNKFQDGCVEENTNTESLVRRLLSENYADKVIVTTIQKLGLALNSTGRANYKERLEPLRNKRIAFIFDECHRSQFGENHKAIKEFFPNSQLFGFTGTPIFEDNSNYKVIEGTEAYYQTTRDLFDRCLHQYTITHAIDDENVLRFHIDYFKPDAQSPVKPGEFLAKQKIVETILEKHDSATSQRKFNAVLATASINDAIDYFDVFRVEQERRQDADPNFKPLNIAVVFSPPAEGNPDAAQLMEDLPQEFADNQVDPERKKKALTRIINDYNQRYGTNHRITEFDLYYQDVQRRIKDHQYPNREFPASKKIDLTIVVDMLLTGFDSKYLNTLYVDKNLKYHGLIQAFSRTNRVLNDSKPYGNILDFRQQQKNVEDAIALFSGEKVDNPGQIWLVDPPEVVIERYEEHVTRLNEFLISQGTDGTPADVENIRGDASRAQFVQLFKEVQRTKTQLDQYTDIEPEQKAKIAEIMPPATLQAFRGTYLETAKKLQAIRDNEEAPEEIQQLDFEFVLFASAVIDYDYIMGLISNYTQQRPSRQSMSREQLIGLIVSDAKFMDEREDITEYITNLPKDQPLSVDDVKEGYEAFKAEKKDRELRRIAAEHELDFDALQAFVQETLRRRVFDAEGLAVLLAPLELGWKARRAKEVEMRKDLSPLLEKMANGREISGLIR